MAKSTKSLAESIDDAGIFRIIETVNGYEVQQLEKDYNSETVRWSFIESTNSLSKARKELFRLSKGQVA